MFKGHFAVLKNAFRRRVTLEYPEKKNNLNERFRGQVDFNYDNNMKIPCNACGICQRVCPCKDLIKIEREKDEHGKFKLKRFEIDISHCIFCGNCVENCPTNSLKLTKKYELATSDKSDFKLIYEGK